MFIITNNKDVYEKYHETYKIVYYPDASLLDILKKCRDEVHGGKKLLSHPLTGSIKPNETPFKSVMVSDQVGSLDFNTLGIIENAIETTEKFLNIATIKEWPQNILEDFRLIDYGLITSAIESVGNTK